ncbi:unnamed protein product [Rotaria sp. Silwood2]|nr:unnamed protein product [Rotaria sp. Silwood2]
MDTLDALTNTLTKSFKCWECKKELKSENGRLYHFVQQHARAILSIDADPSSSLQKQIQKAEDLLKTTTSNSTTVYDKSMLSTNARLLTKPVNETEAKQDHIKSTDLKNNRIGKTIFCLQCNKKFRSTGKFKKHIDAKHSRINCDTTTSNIRILPDRTLRLNEQLQSENDININAQNSSSCSQYLEQIEPTNNSVHQFTDNHVELATSLHSLPSIPFININSASSYQIKNTEQMNYSASLSCRSSNCVEIFESTSNYDNNLKTKGIEINSSISTKTIDHVNMMKQNSDPSSFLDNQLILAQEDIKTSKDATIAMSASVDCSQYSEQFGLNSDLDQHHEALHNQLDMSNMIESQHSNEQPDHVNENQSKTDEHISTSKSLIFDYSHFRLNFESTTHQDSHLTSVQSMPILTPEITQHTNDFSTALPCWDCSKKFKTVNGRWMHFVSHHILSTISIFEIQSDLDGNKTDSQHSTPNNIVVSSTSLTKQQFKCWSCTKKFQSDQSFLHHFVEKHANFILSLPNNPIDILKNEIIKVKQNVVTSSIDDTATYHCSQELKDSKSTDTKEMNIQSKQDDSFSSNTTLTTNHIDVDMATTQYQKKTAENLVRSINLQHHQVSNTHLFKSTGFSNVDFHNQKLDFDSYISVDLPNTHINQSTITTNQHDAAEHVQSSSKMFSCWKCFEKYKSAPRRLYHFILCHSELFLPATVMPSKSTSKYTILYDKQINKFNVSVNLLSDAYLCWDCSKKFKSSPAQVSHFIDKHAKTILSMDIDPSDILQNQITKAQERMKIKQNTVIDIKASSNFSHCSNPYKANNDLSNHTNSKHTVNILPLTSETRKYVDNKTKQMIAQTKVIQDVADPINMSLDSSKFSFKFDTVDNSSISLNMKYLDVMTRATSASLNNFLPKRSLLRITYYCQQCQKKFTSVNDHLEHFQNEHRQVKLSKETLEEFFSDTGSMQCPKAKFPTIVYMLLGSTRKQIRITFDKMNHCPYQACQLEVVNYEFKQFWVHIIKEHAAEHIKLECCDPMMMYTPEEYMKHNQIFY